LMMFGSLLTFLIAFSSSFGVLSQLTVFSHTGVHFKSSHYIVYS